MQSMAVPDRAVCLLKTGCGKRTSNPPVFEKKKKVFRPSGSILVLQRTFLQFWLPAVACQEVRQLGVRLQHVAGPHSGGLPVLLHSQAQKNRASGQLEQLQGLRLPRGCIHGWLVPVHSCHRDAPATQSSPARSTLQRHKTTPSSPGNCDVCRPVFPVAFLPRSRPSGLLKHPRTAMPGWRYAFSLSRGAVEAATPPGTTVLIGKCGKKKAPVIASLTLAFAHAHAPQSTASRCEMAGTSTASSSVPSPHPTLQILSTGRHGESSLA